jgi:hypothetical protein
VGSTFLLNVADLSSARTAVAVVKCPDCIALKPIIHAFVAGWTTFRATARPP